MDGPDPLRALTFTNLVAAELAIGGARRLPLTKLAADDLAFINDRALHTLVGPARASEPTDRMRAAGLPVRPVSAGPRPTSSIAPASHRP